MNSSVPHMVMGILSAYSPSSLARPKSMILSRSTLPGMALLRDLWLWPRPEAALLVDSLRLAQLAGSHGCTSTMFCGFRSRWRMRLEWMKSTPFRICLSGYEISVKKSKKKIFQVKLA